jgi:hypothetical protein
MVGAGAPGGVSGPAPISDRTPTAQARIEVMMMRGFSVGFMILGGFRAVDARPRRG